MTPSTKGQFEAMVLTLIELTGRVLPGMRERNWGRILTIASTSVVQPIPNLGISNTLRASMVTWGKTLSLEVAPYGITVNTILPGRIHTQRVDELDAAAARKQGRPVEDIARDDVSARDRAPDSDGIREDDPHLFGSILLPAALCSAARYSAFASRAS